LKHFAPPSIKPQKAACGTVRFWLRKKAGRKKTGAAAKQRPWPATPAAVCNTVSIIAYFPFSCKRESCPQSFFFAPKAAEKAGNAELQVHKAADYDILELVFSG